jgi:hypothetical protein
MTLYVSNIELNTTLATHIFTLSLELSEREEDRGWEILTL